MSSADFFKKYQPLFEAKAPDLAKAGQKAIKNMKAAEKEKKEKEKEKPTNVKETAAEFFRKYSDMIAEAEEAVEEGKMDDLADRRAAKKEKDADEYNFGDDDKKTKREVKGKAYGGSKQKDDDEE